MNKVILIDDDHARGWADVFRAIFTTIYGDLITFEVLTDISNEAIDQCYMNNENAVFIQDNQLSYDKDSKVKDGIEWIKKYGKKRCIIMNSADASIAVRAAQYGSKVFMQKDDPERPMTTLQMQNMIICMHKIIIHHFKLIPELMWLVYRQLGMI
jgi:hypothetical protein